MRYPTESNGDEPTTAEIIMAVIILAMMSYLIREVLVWFLAA